MDDRRSDATDTMPHLVLHASPRARISCSMAGLAHRPHLTPRDAGPLAARPSWTGGQGTEPWEQKTQQSPGFGRSVAPHPVQT